MGRQGTRADVVVVGAGLSGLVAATRLSQAGASVVVLEARDRVGGRLESADLAGTSVDLGGSWIGAAHTRVRALLDELDLQTFPTQDRGERVVVRQSRLGRGRLARRLTTRSVAKGVAELDRLARAIAVDEPCDAPGAAELDPTTLAGWLTSGARWPRGREVLRDMLVNVLAAESHEVSLRHALWYLASNGGLAGLIATRGGAQQDLVVGGAQAIAERLAQPLGDAVLRGVPVRAIEDLGTRVRVVGDGIELEAERAVIALSPTLAARITFTPAPPPISTPVVAAGDAIKFVAIYDEAFWRSADLSGMAWGDDLPFSFSHDVSDRSGTPGALAIFVLGDRARRLRSSPAAERPGVITGALARCFGTRAAQPLALTGRDWTRDPWALGGYGGVASPGAWTGIHDANRCETERILIAGTEASARYHGYMEGAVRAGERAAAILSDSPEAAAVRGDRLISGAASSPAS